MTARPPPSVARDLYDLLTGDEDARVCRDIPDAACREQPRNFLVHLIALSATKIGDALADAKLTLAWVLGAMGAPVFLTALLVPVRESLSLLPQLFIAARIRRVRCRKGFWIAGSIVQGACALGMGLVALAMDGAAGGFALLGLLAVFSLARGVCSVASKDVLGKTVSKSRRGTLNGYAASLAGFAAVGIGVAVQVAGGSSAAPESLAALLLAAGALWLLAAAVYGSVAEEPGATGGGGDAIRTALASLSLLRDDAELRRFLVARALLLATALSAPFYVAVARARTGGEIAGLGTLIVASGLASAASAPVWGRLADRSSRRVMAAAAAVAGLLGCGYVLALRLELAAVSSIWFHGAALLVLGVAHAGARLGRKTHLLDIADADNRAAYVAVSNTLIGVVLLLAGSVGALAQWLGPADVVLALALVAFAASACAWRLREVQ